MPRKVNGKTETDSHRNMCVCTSRMSYSYFSDDIWPTEQHFGQATFGSVECVWVARGRNQEIQAAFTKAFKVMYLRTLLDPGVLLGRHTGLLGAVLREQHRVEAAKFGQLVVALLLQNVELALEVLVRLVGELWSKIRKRRKDIHSYRTVLRKYASNVTCSY